MSWKMESWCVTCKWSGVILIYLFEGWSNIEYIESAFDHAYTLYSYVLLYKDKNKG